MFSVYFKLGIEHLLDWNGYDHMLFLLALCIPFIIKDWKKLLILATSFTIGHSITLALAVTDLIKFSSAWIEFFIPVTICLTAIFDWFIKKDQVYSWQYLLAAIFGLIHGMGFSNLLKSMMMTENKLDFITQLLAFNLGIEVGQIVVVTVLLLLLTLLNKVSGNIKWKDLSIYKLVLTLFVFVWAAWMSFGRIPF